MRPFLLGFFHLTFPPCHCSLQGCALESARPARVHPALSHVPVRPVLGLLSHTLEMRVAASYRDSSRLLWPLLFLHVFPWGKLLCAHGFNYCLLVGGSQIKNSRPLPLHELHKSFLTANGHFLLGVLLRCIPPSPLPCSEGRSPPCSQPCSALRSSSW